jgi:hypothetical protein
MQASKHDNKVLVVVEGSASIGNGGMLIKEKNTEFLV